MCAVRCGAIVALAAVIAFTVVGAVAARSFESGPAVREVCNPCPLTRTVVDTPAWDETVTVVDQAPWDETITIVDRPATTAYRTVVEVPAGSIAHHDLVSPGYTVARQVLVTPAHTEPYQLWVSSGYWGSQWVDTSHYQPTQAWVSSGYWGSQWVDTSHYETSAVFVSSGYWSGYWVDTSHWQYSTYYVSSGYWASYWVDTGGYWAWAPVNCWGGDCYGGYSYWVPTGYYQSYWVDTSYWTGQWTWVSSGYWNTVWIDTSHWEYPLVWVSSGYWGSVWINTSHWETQQVWVWSGYWGSIWVDTSHYETRYRYVDDVFRTVYDTIPAVYNDWVEQVPAVTHDEAYTVPAVTHTTVAHHAAVTHTALVHHPATTHEVPISPDELATQNRQTAGAPSVGAAQSGSTATSTASVPVITAITLVDTPAHTTTRTVMDHAAFDEAVQTPVYGNVGRCWGRGEDRECDDFLGVVGYQTSTVHHDAVTHQETVTVAAVTHEQTLSFDANVGTGGGTGDASGLAGIAMLLGLTGLSKAGRLLSREDRLRVATNEWAQTGAPLPSVLVTAIEDGQLTDSEADAVLATLRSDAPISGPASPKPQPTPPPPALPTPRPTPSPQPGAAPAPVDDPPPTVVQISVGLGVPGLEPLGVGRSVTWVPDTGQIYVSRDYGVGIGLGVDGSLLVGAVHTADGSVATVPLDPDARRKAYDEVMLGHSAEWRIGAVSAAGGQSIGPDGTTVDWSGVATPGVSVGSSDTQTLYDALAQDWAPLINGESAALSLGEAAVINDINIARAARDAVIGFDQTILNTFEDVAIMDINSARAIRDGVIAADSAILSAGEDLVIDGINAARDVRDGAHDAVDWIRGLFDGSRDGNAPGGGGGGGSWGDDGAAGGGPIVGDPPEQTTGAETADTSDGGNDVAYDGPSDGDGEWFTE